MIGSSILSVMKLLGPKNNGVANRVKSIYTCALADLISSFFTIFSLLQTIEAMISEQNSKMKDLREARLEYINMKNLVVKKKRQLTEMEHVDSGLRIQDFQQLQIDHQSLDRKIEDR